MGEKVGNIPTESFVQVWVEGGWVMIPLFLLTIFIYYEALSLIFHLKKARPSKTVRANWQEWVKNPDLAAGNGFLGDVVQYIVASGYGTKTVLSRVNEVKNRIVPNVNQKVVLISVLVTIAPLTGLLGTVIGMLTTFKGLAASAGQTVDLVADGIRVALITTQTGLMVAIPGYILLYLIVRRRNMFVTFVSQVENYAIQYGASRAQESSST